MNMLMNKIMGLIWVQAAHKSGNGQTFGQNIDDLIIEEAANEAHGFSLEELQAAAIEYKKERLDKMAAGRCGKKNPIPTGTPPAPVPPEPVTVTTPNGTYKVPSYHGAPVSAYIPIPTPEPEPATKRRSLAEAKAFRDRYCAWANDHTYYPSDEAVAYFTGVPPYAMSKIRTGMIADGFSFSRNKDHSWAIVTRPVVTKKVPELTLAEKLTIAVNEGRSVEVAALIMELMQGAKK